MHTTNNPITSIRWFIQTAPFFTHHDIIYIVNYFSFLRHYQREPLSLLGGGVAGFSAGAAGCVLTAGVCCLGCVSAGGEAGSVGFAVSAGGWAGLVVVPPLAGPLGCPGGSVGVCAGCSVGNGFKGGFVCSGSAGTVFLAGWVIAGASFFSAAGVPPKKNHPTAAIANTMALTAIQIPEEDFFSCTGGAEYAGGAE